MCSANYTRRDTKREENKYWMNLNNVMEIKYRRIREDELNELLGLYKQLLPEDEGLK